MKAPTTLSEEARQELLAIFQILPTREFIWGNKTKKEYLQRELKVVSDYVEERLNINQPKKRKD